MREHIKDVLSGKYGTISTARVVSCVFALFTLIVLSLVIKHMLAIDSAPRLHEWVEAIPALGGVLVGLTGCPTLSITPLAHYGFETNRVMCEPSYSCGIVTKKKLILPSLVVGVLVTLSAAGIGEFQIVHSSNHNPNAWIVLAPGSFFLYGVRILDPFEHPFGPTELHPSEVVVNCVIYSLAAFANPSYDRRL
jgi:hypothetical protein